MRNKLSAIISAAAIGVAIGCMGSGGSVSTTGATNGTTATSGGGGTVVPVTMNNDMTFGPQVVNAHAGDTIRWTNTGALHHTVASDTGQAGMSSDGQFPAGLGQDDTFDWPVPSNAAVGTHYFYHCTFHGLAGDGSTLGTGMAGEITID